MGRMKSTSSFGSSRLDQSQKTGLSLGSSSAGNSSDNNSDDDEGDGLTNATRDIQQDPIFMNLNTMFAQVCEEIVEQGLSRQAYLKRLDNKVENQ